MNQNSPTPALMLTLQRLPLGVAPRLAILIALLFSEKILLNGFVDFASADAAQGFGWVVRITQHWGFRFLVALAAALFLFAYVTGGEQLRSADQRIRATPLRLVWLLPHACCVAALVPLSSMLYGSAARLLPFPVVVTLWLVLASAALGTAVRALAPIPLWINAARALGVRWFYALLAAMLGASAMYWSQQLWAPTAALTFDLVRWVLSPVIPSLAADPATHILSTSNFAVQIADICSGLEGMGLMFAFSSAWLLYFRREYIFPRALLLISIGIVSMYALNVLRIVALVAIGNAGYPNVAIYGFHSQAGWIAFTAAACALVFFSRRSAWFTRNVSNGPLSATENPTATYLMPFLAILAAGTISHAMSGKFELFYPLRLIAGAAALIYYSGKLRTALDWRFSWRGPAIGMGIAAIWIFAAARILHSAAMPDELATLSLPLRLAWIASRLAAAIITVPIAEELAYRGFLMRRLMSSDFDTVPFRTVRWSAVLITAIVFGFTHGQLWLPGIAAGIAYGLLLRQRGSMGEAVAAHATTNLILACVVLRAGQWQLW